MCRPLPATPPRRQGERGKQLSNAPRRPGPRAVSAHQLAHLGCQHIEVASAIGSADELALVPGRHPRVLGHPRHGKREPVGAVVVTIESFTLLLPEALAGGWEGRKHRQETKGRKQKTVSLPGVPSTWDLNSSAHPQQGEPWLPQHNRTREAGTKLQRTGNNAGAVCHLFPLTDTPSMLDNEAPQPSTETVFTIVLLMCKINYTGLPENSNFFDLQ